MFIHLCCFSSCWIWVKFYCLLKKSYVFVMLNKELITGFLEFVYSSKRSNSKNGIYCRKRHFTIDKNVTSEEIYALLYYWIMSIVLTNLILITWWMILILKTLHKKIFNQKNTHMIPVSTDPPNKKSKIRIRSKSKKTRSGKKSQAQRVEKGVSGKRNKTPINQEYIIIENFWRSYRSWRTHQSSCHPVQPLHPTDRKNVWSWCKRNENFSWDKLHNSHKQITKYNWILESLYIYWKFCGSKHHDSKLFYPNSRKLLYEHVLTILQ